MRVSDLKIGNIVFIEQYNEPQEICQITKGGNFSTNNFLHSYGSIECAKGNVITEKVLEKYGFELIDEINERYIINNDLYTSMSVLLPRTKNSIICSVALIRNSTKEAFELDGIKYEHQLQNLYFEIYRQELRGNEILPDDADVYVNFEQAKWLKANGYNNPTEKVYVNTGWVRTLKEINSVSQNIQNWYFMPTVEQVENWMFKKYKIEDILKRQRNEEQEKWLTGMIAYINQI